MHPVKRLLGRRRLAHGSAARAHVQQGVCAGTSPENHQRLPLHLNVCWALAGNIVYAAFGWGMLMAIAKLGSAEQVGIYAIGLAAVGPVIALFNLDLRTIQATDAAKGFPFGIYLALRLAMTAAAFAVIVGLAQTSLYRTGDASVIIAAGIAAAVEALSDVIFGFFQQRERLDRIAISMILKAPLGTGAMILALLLTGSVVHGFLLVAVARAVILLGYDIPSVFAISRSAAATAPGRTAASAVRPIWDFRELRALVFLALPLGFSMLLLSLNMNIPRYFISHSLGKADLGVYCAMLYVMQIGVMFVISVSYSASPLLARYYAASRLRSYSLLLAKLVGMGLAIGAVAALAVDLFGYEILLFFYTADFAEHADVFTWVAIAFGIGYAAEFLGIGVYAARYFAIQLPLQLFAVAATTLGCSLLVPQYGLHGAVGAVMLSKAVQALGGLLVCTYAVVQAARRREAPLAGESALTASPSRSDLAVEFAESNPV